MPKEVQERMDIFVQQLKDWIVMDQVTLHSSVTSPCRAVIGSDGGATAASTECFASVTSFSRIHGNHMRGGYTDTAAYLQPCLLQGVAAWTPGSEARVFVQGHFRLG
ncbi:hypothetical protein VaNZ11_006166 [Volvox africanus]|uniref:Uncharacterized protein n=1 Tax=Volvox africanus TaxID=51714 RepID=A0ABQ5S1R2_9CHLO|nr:hypothetical protein VaNZ11_006166 [Volvox africanus]